MKQLTPESKTLLGQAVAAYQDQLGDEGLLYLEERGINPSVASTYRLGYVAEATTSDHEQYTGRLVIPYLTRGGIVNVKFRCLRDHDCKEAGHGKYTGLPGRCNLYNVSALFDAADTIAICEGELDALVLSAQAGIPAVGMPGASAWQPHYRYIFADYTRILVFADGDEAGKKMGVFLQEKLSATVINMPKGHDVNSIYLQEGPEWLLAKL